MNINQQSSKAQDRTLSVWFQKLQNGEIKLLGVGSGGGAVMEAQKTHAQASLAQAEDLINSLLQRAFKGELV
jgi:hypothetical protein